MRILALVSYPYDRAPGQRYRIEQWTPLLEQLGAEIVFEPFRGEELHSLLCQPGNTTRKVYLASKALDQRLRLIKRISEFDVVYIYNEAAMLGPALIERFLNIKRVPIVFDFDDAIFLHYTYISPVNRYLRLLKFPGKTKTICRLASHVLAGNDYLAGYASRFNPHVTIVPSTVDTNVYAVDGSRKPSDPLVIGWTGSYSTVQYLNTLRSTLQELAKRERFKLRVIGVPNYQLEGVEVEAVPWNSETEVADLKPVDVGIMPLPDDPWTRGKCGMKALQYMGLGIPTVCSPVGVNSTIIRTDENGLLAGTEDQWLNQLTRLLHSAALRDRLGKAGRATVEAEYSMSIHAPRVYQIFESVVRQRSRTKMHRQSRTQDERDAPITPLDELNR